MTEQLSIFDYLKPDYQGSRDEIVRDSIEDRFTEQIHLFACSCGESPIEMFRSCHEYFVRCPKCKTQTKMYKHLYEAKQAWNKGEK